MNKNTLISAVSSFNKELFHSRAITWLLNNYPLLQRAFLESILDTSIVKEAIFVKAIAELRQIDILVIYKIDNNLHFIHIENKIKALESFKRKDEHTKTANINRLSQTEYYFVRLGSDDFCKTLSEEITKDLNERFIGGINYDSINLVGNIKKWKFIFLKPSHVLNEKIPKLNYWRDDITGPKKSENPWITKTYENLIVENLCKVERLSGSGKEYLSLLKSEFTSSTVELNSASYLKKDNVNDSVKNKLNVVETSALQEWFLLLATEINHYKRFHSIIQGFKQKRSDVLGFESIFVTDSGNNSGFLIQASFIIPDFRFPDSKNSQQKSARIGLQYEHNFSSGKMKLFFAAHDYNNVFIKAGNMRKKYNEHVKSFLSDENFKNLKNSLCFGKNFNGSKGKSFCSRTIDIINYQSYHELKEYFIENLDNLSKDIQILKYETWRNFIENINLK